MKVLVACEFSGRVRDAFRARGHDAWSCDIFPTESTILDEFGCIPHIQGDVLGILDAGWDLMIAFPPCTYLCNSGVRWLYKKDGVTINENRWYLMRKAADFFRWLFEAHISKIALENPIPYCYAAQRMGYEYNQIIQPWQFGHGETKATCLWLKNLPKLQPTNIVAGREARIHKMPPSKDRGKLRSITYQGIADAMASQWG